MSAVTDACNLMNNYTRWPIRLVKGKGNTVWDDQGKEYLDCTSGIAVTSLGHVPPQVTERLHQQLDQLWHTSNLFEHPLQEQLAAKLAQLSGLDRVFFCNSGAEANEAAIKLARRYQQKVKGEQRYEIITFRQSFHGRTLATLTATGQDKVKDGFLPLPEGFATVPYNDLPALSAAISPHTCAVMLELVQGEGGVLPADPQWVSAVAQLCAKTGVLLIIDEIQTGVGRTGSWFAYQQYGIKPDIVSLAKGLGSGFPVGAILAGEEVGEAFSPGTHGSTFGGNPLAMAAGLATLQVIEQEQLLQRVGELNRYLISRLEQIKESHPGKVTAVRGMGLLVGIELSQSAADVVSHVREKGVLILQAGPQVVRLLPSFVTTEAELDRLTDALDEAIAAL
ncbi:acetylornithine transaminase [Brevibacillus humidisoli]|uniref:acetylornithine transaminase n=1 Tax=Brevibacillus humidisoli TaxID=2895522 RepID=UPI002407C107|nr:acetylornithine transaminase [Brevibacillus humidisoli]